MSHSNASDRRLILLVLLTVLGAAPGAIAQQPVNLPDVEPSLSAMSAELLAVQRSLQNARAKLGRGILSGPGGESDGDLPDTPGFRCCATNLQTMDAALRRVLSHVDGLARQAAAADDQIALGQLELIHDGVMGLGLGLKAFATSAEQRRASAALDGMIRPFNMATAAVRGLSACCAERFLPTATSDAADEPEPGADANTKKKKKRKRRSD